MCRSRATSNSPSLSLRSKSGIMWPPFWNVSRKAYKTFNMKSIFVDDDSPDGTAEQVRAIARRDPRVRVVQRSEPPRPGLSVRGRHALHRRAVPRGDGRGSSARRAACCRTCWTPSRRAKVSTSVVGSRNIAGGSMGKFARWRGCPQHARTHVSVPPSAAVRCTDPHERLSSWSGASSSWKRRTASPASASKFLVDLLASSRRRLPSIVELPYAFRDRLHRREASSNVLGRSGMFPATARQSSSATSSRHPLSCSPWLVAAWDSPSISHIFAVLRCSAFARASTWRRCRLRASAMTADFLPEQRHHLSRRALCKG
jgi:hypothetical protein